MVLNAVVPLLIDGVDYNSPVDQPEVIQQRTGMKNYVLMHNLMVNLGRLGTLTPLVILLATL